MTANLARVWPYPRLVAHRGAGKLAPENRLTAMRVGHAHGYRMVEFDVKLAADGVSFLLHDATLERATSGRRRARPLPSRGRPPRRCRSRARAGASRPAAAWRTVRGRRSGTRGSR